MAKQNQKGGDDVLLNISVTGRQEITGAKEDAKSLNTELNKGGKVDLSAAPKALKTQLREAVLETQRLFAAGKQNTAEYTESARRVQALRNDIDELNNTFRAFDPDNKFRVFANAAAAGAKAVQGYAGAMAFLGVEGETANETLSKLAGVMAFADAIDSLGDLKDSFKDVLRMIGLTTVATTELSAAETTQTVATEAAATATGALAVSEEGATVAAYGLGAALKAIGIGLIISALAFLITNFDSVKKTVTDLFPALKSTGESFDKIKQIAFGVGNAILQFVIAPIKILFHLLTGDFQAAIEDFKKGADVLGNYAEGAAKEAAEQAEGYRIERIKKEIEANERIIKERKALGKATYDLEVATQKKRIEVLNASDKEYAKNRADAESELTQIIYAEQKRRSDKEKELLKADLEKIKEANLEAIKVIDGAKSSQQRVELSQLDSKYKKEFELLERRKKDVKDYNQEYANLTRAREIEVSGINKKYNDLARDFIAEVGAKELDSYAEQMVAIQKKATDLIRISSEENAAKIRTARDAAIARIGAEATASDIQKRAATKLTKAEDENRPSNTDTAEEATAKINAVESAKIAAENAAYQLKKLQLQGQNLELEQLAADHQAALRDTEEQAVYARLEIATREKEGKLALYNEIATALDVAGDIAGKSTIAGKTLAVASATISTYLAAQKAYESAFLPVPTLASPALGAVSAGVAVATGLQNIKNILKVQVPGGGGGSGGTGGPAPSAPTINTTVLNQNRTGADNIVSAVNKNTDQRVTARAYIVDKDLKDNAEKSNYFNQQSTY